MTQTRDGYLWLGTQAGLVRFDGIGHISAGGRVEFPVFDDSNGLNARTVVKLFEDSRGNLWIGSEADGILLVNSTGKVTRIGDLGRGKPAERLTSISEDQSGAVWFYTANDQLCRFKNNVVDVWNAGRNVLSTCRALVLDDEGLLWVGTDWNLSSFKPDGVISGSDLPWQPKQPITRLDFILGSSQGGVWRLADGRIQRFKKDHLEQDLGPYPWAPDVPVVTACEDRAGGLLVGTYGDGVYWIDKTGKASRVQQLSHSYILSLVLDREGCLWIGTNGRGLNRAKRQAFQVLPGSEGLVVQSVAQDKDDGLWIAYNGERIDHWNNGTLERFTNVWPAVSSTPRPFEINMRSVYVDTNNQVWAGAAAAWGSRLFDLREGRFQPVSDGANLMNRDVAAITQDRNGVLWVGTQSGLVYRDHDVWKTLALSNSFIRAIADDNLGNLWIGTAGGGLNRLYQGQITIFGKKDGLPSDDIASLYVDDDQALWIGTSLGLARLKAGKCTAYTTQDGLISNNIGYLLEDYESCLWMGSNAGLVRAKKRDLNAFADGSTNRVPCRAYGKAEGLPVSECTFGSQPGACRTRDGKLWFPTISGLASLNPLDLNQNTNPPPVLIESILVEGQLQNTNVLRARLPESIILQPGKESLEIDYTSLNLGAPERARFRYRMEGHETKWTEAGNVRAAHYSQLPPGQYRFHVKACNEDEVWNEIGSALSVTVLPPFWRTAWFLTLVTLALLGIIVGSVHYVSTQKLQRQLAGLRQQEALEKERARIARDLHDQLGANLTQVALLGELAETDKDHPSEVESHARQISQTARDTTHALDEIVWTVNPSNDTLEGLVNYVCKYAQEYLALAGLQYRLEVPDQLPDKPISPELRHNMFLAAKEAVNNVVKHAHATCAWLRLRLEPTRFTLEIEDNGAGVSGLDRKRDRSGLRNMTKRMEDVGGNFSIAPGTEGGTLVRLTAPFKTNSQAR